MHNNYAKATYNYSIGEQCNLVHNMWLSYPEMIAEINTANFCTYLCRRYICKAQLKVVTTYPLDLVKYFVTYTTFANLKVHGIYLHRLRA